MLNTNNIIKKENNLRLIKYFINYFIKVHNTRNILHIECVREIFPVTFILLNFLFLSFTPFLYN
jgi:hypothetical protein